MLLAYLTLTRQAFKINTVRTIIVSELGHDGLYFMGHKQKLLDSS